MSLNTRQAPIISAWLVCLAILTSLVAGFVATDDNLSVFEREAGDELAKLKAAPASSLRIVILGNSLARMSTSHSPDLEAELRRFDYDVTVANISGGDRWWDSYESLQDEILAADPDLLIMQVEMFGTGISRGEGDIRSLVRFRLGQPLGLSAYFTSKCDGPGDFAVWTEQVPDRLRLPAAGIEWGARLVGEAEAQGTEVYLLAIPRSDELVTRVGPVVDAFHDEVLQQLSGASNVTASPDVSGGSTDGFCDYSHMNEIGQARFLEQVLPDLTDLLDTISPS